MTMFDETIVKIAPSFNMLDSRPYWLGNSNDMFQSSSLDYLHVFCQADVDENIKITWREGTDVQDFYLLAKCRI